jgi:hypothetical protein
MGEPRVPHVKTAALSTELRGRAPSHDSASGSRWLYASTSHGDSFAGHRIDTGFQPDAHNELSHMCLGRER